MEQGGIMVKEIFLFRHGQTDYNVNRLFYGSTDISINDCGKKQAERVYYDMHAPVERVYISGLKRTLETAKIMFPQHHYISVGAFNEKGFGCWEGLDANEIAKHYPQEWQAWLEAPFDYTPPQAEPFVLFRRRVVEGLQQILKEERVECIAIVAHLGVLRVIYQTLVDEQAVFWDIDFPQGEIASIRLEQNIWNHVERTRLHEIH